jgi:hypothetical protein
MRRLLIILALLLVVVGAVGIYRGWFDFSSARQDQKLNINVTVDEEKIQQDVEQVQEAGRKATKRVGGSSDQDEE